MRFHLHIHLLIIALCCYLNPAHAEPSAFQLAGTRIPIGEQRSFNADVPGTEMVLPITIFHGNSSGPVLTLSAGTHGDEFPAIIALQRLRREIDPATLSGTLVLVHAANLPALHQRSLSPLHPVDGKNLNREFPGNAKGSPTERLAAFMTKEIVGPSDYLADLHSGSADQRLWPHIYAPFVGNKELDARTLEWAKASGMRHIVLYGDRPRDPANSISYPNTAMTRGKPGLTLEIGDRGLVKERDVIAYLKALRGLMVGINMLSGESPSNSGRLIYQGLEEVASPAMGLFESYCKIGELVEKEALLGIVRDYFGEPLAELRAPRRGVVLILQNAPPVNKGTGLITLGIE